MICRLWRGFATPEKADAYEHVVRTQVIPGIEAKKIAGFRRIDLMRRPLASGEVEFQTLMWFDSLASIKAFTGEDYETAYVPDAARAVLARFDDRAAHFTVLEERHQPAGAYSGALQAPLDRAALVLIDVQEGFEDPDWGDRNNPGAEANVGKLLEAWRRARWPIHHVHHASRSPLGKFRRGTAGHQPKAEATPRPGEPIHLKEVNSGFIGTDLEASLRADGVNTVVVAGLTTNHCVSTTIRMAGNLGFETYLVEDATAAFARRDLGGQMRSAQAVHDAALSDLHDEFASVVSTAQVVSAVQAE